MTKKLLALLCFMTAAAIALEVQYIETVNQCQASATLCGGKSVCPAPLNATGGGCLILGSNPLDAGVSLVTSKPIYLGGYAWACEYNAPKPLGTSWYFNAYVICA
jgi:hypothetical protein